MQPYNRRSFIGKAALVSSAILVDPLQSLQAKPVAPNKLPKWKGFNLLDFFSPDPAKARQGTEEEYFKWMSDWGFDFVRIPMAYPSYIKFDRSKPIDPRRVTKFDLREVKKLINWFILPINTVSIRV